MTIEWYIKNVVMKDLGRTVFTPGLQFLSFGMMGPTIEFFGACFDDDSFFEPYLSESRFRKAIDSLDSLKDYRPYNTPPTPKNGPYPPHDLFANMRCGMAHIGSPGFGVAFTERGNPDEWDKHLQIWKVDDPKHPNRLILVCEDLYFDISKAADELLQKMKSGDPDVKKKHDASFLTPNLRLIQKIS